MNCSCRLNSVVEVVQASCLDNQVNEELAIADPEIVHAEIAIAKNLKKTQIEDEGGAIIGE